MAAKEQMRAINHTLQQLNCDLDEFKPVQPLRPIDALNEKRLLYRVQGGLSRPFVVNMRTGASHWDEPAGGPDLKRLTLCPDEGSSLFTVFQYLSGHGFCLHLNRDSLQPSLKLATVTEH